MAHILFYLKYDKGITLNLFIKLITKHLFNEAIFFPLDVEVKKV